MGNNFNRSELLQYPESEIGAIEIQKRGVEFIKGENAISIQFEDITTIAGVDLTYVKKEGKEYGIACTVLWQVQNNEEISHVFAIEEVDFPYISGLLAFREIRIAVQAINKLLHTPDVIIFDGHGYAHPRRFGAAVAIGVAMNIPSIGIAKRPLVGGWNWKHMQRKAGNKKPVFHNNELVGYVIVLVDDRSPVFISVGYKIELITAIKLALQTAQKHKQPECLGRAHNLLQSSKWKILSDFKSQSA